MNNPRNLQGFLGLIMIYFSSYVVIASHNSFSKLRCNIFVSINSNGAIFS